jgi:ATP-dependent DNA helicase DinG
MNSKEGFAEILGPSGPIAGLHPKYEFRPGQIRMAQAIAGALDARRHLCVEAGTGTGKTLAYLLPCIESRKRVIISTGTKNLQEQLYFKDIPFLERALGRKLSVCYMKGRSNYLCLVKLAEMEGERYLFSPQDPKYLEIIREWSRTTETGDISELRELPEDFPLWHHLNARREICAGQKCPDFKECFVTKIRKRALESDLVIVNHHLFFADLALRQGDFGAVLPDYSVVVFDEAHELEDVASQYFGIMVSNYRFDELVRDTNRALSEAGPIPANLKKRLDKLTRNSGDFFSSFRRSASEGRYVFQEIGEGAAVRRKPRDSDGVVEPYRALTKDLVAVASGIESHPQQSEMLESLGRRCAELQEGLTEIMESDAANRVYWYETRSRGVFLWASPIQIAPILRERLFAKTESVILTSATLATAGNFQFIRSRLGLDDCDELVLGSHFDFARQAILYVPRNIPEPREDGWVQQACLEVERILEASQGRAFVLFTSYRQMELVHDALSGRLNFPMFLQGEKSKTALLEDFRNTPNAVLFATSSFWQGVDVQGDQLSCVIIDKLPFSVPNDPVVAARIRQIEETGGNAFYDYQIPEAIIQLKQGFGRLIRSKKDRGILALLDKRVVTKGYGGSFLRSMPPAPLMHDWRGLKNFIGNVQPSP